VVLAVVMVVMRVGGFEPISGLGWVLWMWRESIQSRDEATLGYCLGSLRAV
jgi:hypothetical protein